MDKKWDQYNPLIIFQKKDQNYKIKKKVKPLPINDKIKENELVRNKKAESIQVMQKCKNIEKQPVKKMLAQQPLSNMQKSLMMQKKTEKKEIQKKQIFQLDLLNYDPMKKYIPPPVKKTKLIIQRSESPKLNMSPIANISTNDILLDQILKIDDNKISQMKGNLISDTVEMFICKELVLVYEKNEIPTFLVSEIRPILKFPMENEIKCKFHPAEKTVKFLIDTPDRSIIFGQIQYNYRKQKQNLSLLYQMSKKMDEENLLIGLAYDDKNSKLCILPKRLLEKILIKRQLKLKAPNTAVIIQEFAKNNNGYIEWWNDNSQYHSHNLYYLIYYKQPSLCSVSFETIHLENKNKYHHLIKEPNIKQPQDIQDLNNRLRQFFKLSSEKIQQLTNNENETQKESHQSDHQSLSNITEEDADDYKKLSHINKQKLNSNINNYQFQQEYQVSLNSDDYF